MLIETLVTLKWNSKIKKHYAELGYVYTKMKDEFIVNSKDLTIGSNVEITVSCDYCGDTYIIRNDTRNIYLKNSIVKKDACSKCKYTKQKESNMDSFGYENPMMKQEFVDKIKTTFIQKYGVENVFQNEKIKEKIKKACIDKYGVENPMQSEEIRGKVITTNIERYGCENPMHNMDIVMKITGKNSCRWKGGAKIHGRWRNTNENREWRKAVFKRDDYTCMCCGSRGFEINAHHIFNYATHKDMRFDLDNGITLCKKCHKQFHSKYGITENNYTQINEFIKLKDEKIC